MPTNPPRSSKKQNSSVQMLVKAERLTQMAFALPASVLVGWLIGAGLDHWLHQHWIYLAGIFVGIFAGFVQIFRLIQTIDEPGGKSGAASGSLKKKP
jgi:F0F1-type ATP synthase assembly protein I